MRLCASSDRSTATTRWFSTIPRKNRSDIELALTKLGFHGDLDLDCRKLSFGNLRKLLISEALSSGESLVVLDEALMGLDETGVTGLTKLVTEASAAGTCVILAEQHNNQTPWVATTFILNQGNLEMQAESSPSSELRLTGTTDKLDKVRVFASTLDLQEISE